MEKYIFEKVQVCFTSWFRKFSVSTGFPR